MGVRWKICRDIPHPWHAQAGWDGMDVEADTREELDAFVAKAEKKFWCAWIVGTNTNTGRPGAYLYKPQGARAKWQDNP